MHAFYFRKKLCEIKVNAIFLIQIAEKRFWGQEEILEEILQEILEILGTRRFWGHRFWEILGTQYHFPMEILQEILQRFWGHNTISKIVRPASLKPGATRNGKNGRAGE